MLEENKMINGGLDYTGTVRIKLQKNDKTYKEVTYHNHGTRKLFDFINDCMAGRWTEAKSQRPCKVVLFRYGKSEGSDAPATHFDSNNWNESNCMSMAVLYDSSAVTKSIQGDVPIGNNEVVHEDVVATTYHFRIPAMYLDDKAEIYKIGLYPQNITNYADDLCAYFNLVDNDGNWDAIIIPQDAYNYNIIVDWTIAVANRGTTYTL